jgi:5'-deoxynucleotidase YfbR-like HD superfamily hydrolase
MSCYFRGLKDVFDAAGIVVTKENRKAVDAAVHELLGLAEKHCPTAWRAFKERVGTDPKARAAFAARLARRLETSARP